MSRYYFHVKDGATSLDSEGLELPDLAAVRKAALTFSGETLRDGADPKLWDGTPWRLRVTDRPDGEGVIVCEVHFLAKTSEA
jgi:hypothetical protein